MLKHKSSFVPPAGRKRLRAQAQLPDFATAPVFTLQEASHFGRWSLSTTRRMIDDDKLAAVKIGGRVRVIGDSLRRYLKGAQ